MPVPGFDRARLPPELEALVRGMNPWWEGRPAQVLPKFRRWAFPRALRMLKAGLAPIAVIRGPRQVGKSTIQNQIIAHLLDEERVDPRRILKVQFDELEALRALRLPIHALVNWFESRIAQRTVNEAAGAGEPIFLMLDEVQNLPEWAQELKSLVDHHSARVLVTGSSALRIEQGNDSLAGRIAPIELGPLRLREIGQLALGEVTPEFLPENGLDPWLRRETWADLQRFGVAHGQARDRAFSRWARRGGYPLVHQHAEVPWAEVADQLVETIVKRAIQHDLRQGQRGRKRDEMLLGEVFRIACRYTGQSPSPALFADDIRSALHANVGPQRISAYLRFLDSALLLRLVPPLEVRLKKKRGAPKICLCDHGLRAAWLQEQVPLTADELASSPQADVAGRIVEGAVGQFFSGVPSLDLAHVPERGTEPEVDFVLTIGTRRIPVEVKYRQRIEPHADTRGLRAFIERTVNNAPFGVLVTLHDNVTSDDPRIVPVSLPSLLLMR